MLTDQDGVKVQPWDASKSLSKLQHLPPVLLFLAFGTNYPENEPPAICDISSIHSWLPLPLIPLIKVNLKGIWRPGEQVLCLWIDHIMSGEFLQSLGQIQLTKHLANILSKYDERIASLKFFDQAFTCLICQTSAKGRKVIQLSCGHVTCRDCLSTYWSYTIRQGDIEHTCCPDASCLKEGSGPRLKELHTVLEPETVYRWETLREKMLSERDPSVTYCPNTFCESAVPAPAGLQAEEAAWNWLRTCARCNFSFCALCRRSWFVFLHNSKVAH
jgi:E3 ubiquitin-protein ligase RNF14